MPTSEGGRAATTTSEAPDVFGGENMSGARWRRRLCACPCLSATHGIHIKPIYPHMHKSKRHRTAYLSVSKKSIFRLCTYEMLFLVQKSKNRFFGYRQIRRSTALALVHMWVYRFGMVPMGCRRARAGVQPPPPPKPQTWRPPCDAATCLTSRH